MRQIDSWKIISIQPENLKASNCKLFVLRIVTWNSNCLLRIIITIIIINYLKPYKCVQTNDYC